LHASVARASLARAGLADRAEVRVGPGAELLPALERDAPFDLVFIDADKPGYPVYLDWALKLTRPGSIIVADNCIRGGGPLAAEVDTTDEVVRAVAEYDRAVAADPRLISIVLPLDDDGTDGFAISIVRTSASA
jgi:caffeoyl-CoA O-methyltransferase